MPIDDLIALATEIARIRATSRALLSGRNERPPRAESGPLVACHPDAFAVLHQLGYGVREAQTMLARVDGALSPELQVAAALRSL